jgi:demethylmenaquinone methyltransferase/2-methoxy-6-polyprenyl-1,4-benzoquinol methylase
MPTEISLVDYYARRANEYERIYSKPERQADLCVLRQWLRDKCAGHHVLEVACGTGYWTEAIASTASTVTAVDLNQEVLEIARKKNFPRRNVSFEKQDAYQLSFSSNPFNVGLAMFWWSHVPKSKLTQFLRRFHQALPPDALLLFADNRYVEGSSTPISRRDEEGNTYQLRSLADGSQYEVLKNFPTESELRTTLHGFGNHLTYTSLDFYWTIEERAATTLVQHISKS